jgi:hypothetical protein
MISKNGNDEKAAAKFPAKSCQVPKTITANAKQMVK